MLFIALAFTALAGSHPAAQSPPPADRLSVFEGTWTREDTPANATFRETCAWLAGGRRHLVCQAEFKSPNRTGQMIRVHSYRQQTYVVVAFMGDAPTFTYTGGPEGERWVFNLQSDRPDNPQRLRIVITPTNDRIRFVEESSDNNGPWKTTEDYTYVRVK